MISDVLTDSQVVVKNEKGKNPRLLNQSRLQVTHKSLHVDADVGRKVWSEFSKQSLQTLSLQNEISSLDNAKVSAIVCCKRFVVNK
jgi:hypothetical protein